MKQCVIFTLAAISLAACTSSKPIPDGPDPVACQDLHTQATVKAPAEPKKKIRQMSALVGDGRGPVRDQLLIGGTPADPKDWPASLYVSAGSSRCSATAVGESAVIIAAHCVSPGGRLTYQIGANNYSAQCDHHSQYRSNSTADWSACLASSPMVGIPFENIATDLELKPGQEVTLTGYGCIRSGGGGGNDGTFRVGKAVVESVPREGSGSYDTVTRGGAALCFGDSGGSAYYVTGTTRKIFGINSRGDIATTSYLSTTSTKAFIDFIKSWSQSKGVKICGIHSDATGCRDAAPQVDRKFVVQTKNACVEGVVSKELVNRKSEIKSAVRQTLQGF